MTQPPAKPVPLRQRDWRAGATWKALPWRTIIINVVLIAALVYVFIPTARELPEIGKAIRTANPLWMAAAAGIAVLGFPAAALSLRACTPHGLPFLRTTAVQVACSFAGTATPASVGSLSLNVRYLTKQGLSMATATGAVALQGVVQVVTHVALLIVLGMVAGEHLEADALGTVRSVLIVLGIVVGVAIIAVLVVPRLRTLVAKVMRENVRPAVAEFGVLLRSPIRLLLAIAGAAGTTLSSAAALWATLLAFGAGNKPVDAAIATMIGGTLASAAPTPGGIGAVEAAITASLTGLGIAAGVALPAMLLYRTFTTYLPVLIGWVVMRRMMATKVL